MADTLFFFAYSFLVLHNSKLLHKTANDQLSSLAKKCGGSRQSTVRLAKASFTGTANLACPVV